MKQILLFLALLASTFGATNPTFDTVNGITITSGTNTFTVGRGTASLTVTTSGTLGTLAYQSGTFSGTSSGTNTGDQTNISGNAATVTTNANLTGPVTSTGNATAIANGAISNAMLANGAVANLSGTNTGDVANTALTTGKLSQFSATSSAELRGVLSDEDGTGAILTTNGSAASLTNFPTFNQNTSGSAASLSATLAVASGGTNITSYAVGDLIYASGTTTLAKLADVATGSVLISGGVTTAPAWSSTPTFTVTNLTGTASININGTVGAGTPNTAAVTTLSTTGNVTMGNTSSSSTATPLMINMGGTFPDAATAAKAKIRLWDDGTSIVAVSARSGSFDMFVNSGGSFRAYVNNVLIWGSNTTNAITSVVATDATSTSTGSIITTGGMSCAKALWVGGLVNIAGATTLTGNLTSNGALITTPEALAPALNAGAAVGVTTLTSTIAVNGVNAVTLANGTNGQIKTVVCTAVTAAGTATVTPTAANGYTTFAFTAAGQSVTIQYFTTGGWVILSVRGATIA